MYKSTLTLTKTLILIGAFMFTSLVFAQTTGGTNTTDGTGTTGGTDTTGGTGTTDGTNTTGNTTGSTDQAACYEWDKFPNERFNLNVKNHSSLSQGTGGTGGTNSGQAQQTAYSVHGKHVVSVDNSGSNNFTAAVEGTVVTAGETSGTTGSTGTNTGSTGAHLGLLAKWVRGDGQSADFARSVTMDCTTDEASSTPNTWTCESRNEFDIYHGTSTLTKVDETQDQACNAFESSQHRANPGLTADTMQGFNASVVNSNQNSNSNQNQNQNPAQ